MEAALQLINGIVVKAALRERLPEDIHLEINSPTALRSSRIDVVESLVSRTLSLHTRLLSLKTTRIMTSYACKYPPTPCSSTVHHLSIPPPACAVSSSLELSCRQQCRAGLETTYRRALPNGLPYYALVWSNIHCAKPLPFRDKPLALSHLLNFNPLIGSS